MKKLLVVGLTAVAFLTSSAYANSGAEKEYIMSLGVGSGSIESESGSAINVDMRKHWKAADNVGLGIGWGIDYIDADLKDDKGASVAYTDVYGEVVAKYDLNEHFDVNGAISYNIGSIGSYLDGNAVGYEIGAKYKLLGHAKNWAFGISHKIVNYDMDVTGGGSSVSIDTSRTIIYVGKSMY